jgi:magnesium chelatase family protein
MIAKVKTLASTGMDVNEVVCESSVLNGMPIFTMVGMAEKSVQESKERIRVVLRELEHYDENITFPLSRITVNLAPAEVIKKGNHYDLAITIALLISQNYIDNKLIEEFVFLGELNLDGTIKRINNIVNYCLFLNEHYPTSTIILPKDNEEEVSYFTNGNMYGFNKITEVIEFIKNKTGKPIQKNTNFNFTVDDKYSIDDIIGQPIAKRALVVAAAGGHNLLMVGEQGSGKTLLAKTMQSLLPPLTTKEVIEVAKIRSLVGVNHQEIMSLNRPFRTPHHTASMISILGGGSKVQPGEVTLAHKGVLFLDELTEFDKRMLDSLRQPLEDNCISISRVNGKIKYPASFQLIATMNPSSKGGFQTSNLTDNPAFKKISGPILDRFDIQLMLYKPSRQDLERVRSKDHNAYHDLITNAISVQEKRYDSQKRNSEMTISEINKYCKLSEEANNYLLDYKEKKDLSLRGFHKILKLARTIADLTSSASIEKVHIIEASMFRLK